MTSPYYPEKDLARSIRPRTFFLFFSVGFVIGDILGIRSDIYSFLLFISLGIFFLLWKKANVRLLIYIAIFGCSIGYTLGEYALIQHEIGYKALSHITKNFTREQSYFGSVEKILYTKERSKVYLVKIDNFDNFDKNIKYTSTLPLWREDNPHIFVEIPINLTLEPGDIIGFEGRIKRNFDFPLEGYDRYAYYNKGFGYLYLTSFTRKIGKSENLQSISRKYLENIFEKYFESDVSGTILGMTIGSIDMLSRTTKDAFTESGISHILVVSGSNIAFLIILTTFFIKYFSFGKYLRLSIIVSLVLLYGFLVGWEVSVVRATIMGLLSYIIVEYGRRGSSQAAFALALIILTIWSPLAPIYDVGFGLSFGATFGILIFHKAIESWCSTKRIPHVITSIISVSIGATLGSIPILVYHFGEIPLAGLLVNLIIGGIIGWILFASVFFIGFHLISHIGNIIFGFFIYIPVKFILILAAFFQHGYSFIVPDSYRYPLSIGILGIFCYIFLIPKEEGEGKQ